MEYSWEENSRLTYNALANYVWSNEKHNVNVLAGVFYVNIISIRNKIISSEIPD
ncbi:hypothetical protein NXX68_21495 [Bacteroides fragilis]|nr:hypothetical protein [Bacteroides fragilis]